MSISNIISSNYTVNQLVDMFRLGEIGIPEIQRDIVWDSDDIKSLIDSINKGFPCGSLILWEPRERDKSLVRAMIRPERRAYFKNKTPKYFLLDGQQRLSALASVMLERPLLQELMTELNEDMPALYANLKKFPDEIEATALDAGFKSPNWVLLNDLFNGTYRTSNNSLDNPLKDQKSIYAFVQRIQNYQFPIQIISGRKYSDVAVIFTRVNSQGTSLTGAEIHLATIVPKWPGITKELRSYRDELHERNYDLDLSFLMRAITVIACGVAQIKKLAERVRDGKLSKPYLNRVWKQTKSATNKVINELNHELLLDKTKFFTSKNVLIPLVCYVAKDKCHSPATSNMMRFFLYSQLSERYGAAAESVLKRDVRYFSDDLTPRQALNELVDDVRREAKQQYRGMKIKPDHISGPPAKNVMLLLMYILMQKREAGDFGNGKKQLLSDIAPDRLHIHHIFPFNYMMQDKTALQFRNEIYCTNAQYRAKVNDIANMTFLGQEMNAAIGDEPPFEYLPQKTDKALRKAHFIPEDESLWHPSKFDDFLGARRAMISKAANSMLRYL